MNHELNATQGVARRHGQKGAFVSKLDDRPRDLRRSRRARLDRPGRALLELRQRRPTRRPPRRRARTRATRRHVRRPARRVRALLLGTPDRPGPALQHAHAAAATRARSTSPTRRAATKGALRRHRDGKAQQLPRLGQLSWENTLRAYNRYDSTLRVGQEDGAAGQLWIYAGTKRRRQRVRPRGLDERRTTSLDVVTRPSPTDAEFRATYGKGPPAEFDLAEIDWDQSGARQNADAEVDGLIAEPDRGRPLGPEASERLLLPHHRGRQRRRPRAERPRRRRPVAARASTTSSSRSSAARSSCCSTARRRRS